MNNTSYFIILFIIIGIIWLYQLKKRKKEIGNYKIGKFGKSTSNSNPEDKSEQELLNSEIISQYKKQQKWAFVFLVISIIFEMSLSVYIIVYYHFVIGVDIDVIIKAIGLVSGITFGVSSYNFYKGANKMILQLVSNSKTK